MSRSHVDNWRRAAKSLVRRALHRMMKAALRARAHPYPVEDEVRCLVVSPHDDDATLGCGGLMLGKRLAGNSVDIVCLTDGSASHPGHPTLDPEALAVQRRLEAIAAVEALCVDLSRIHFVGASDGMLGRLEASEVETLIERIAEILAGVQPDEIFLPCRRDASSEHNAAFLLVRNAIRRVGIKPRLYEFPIWSAWAPQRLFRPLLTSRRVWRYEFSGYEYLKHRALSLHRTQTAPTPPWTKAVLSPDFVSLFRSSEEFFFEMREP